MLDGFFQRSGDGTPSGCRTDPSLHLHMFFGKNSAQVKSDYFNLPDGDKGIARLMTSLGRGQGLSGKPQHAGTRSDYRK